jgi:hypothetical protein
MDDISSFLPDEIRLIAVGQGTIGQAVRMIAGCEFCSANAEIPFDWILDFVTELRGSTTDYILDSPARCPNCRHEIAEKTLVEPTDS